MAGSTPEASPESCVICLCPVKDDRAITSCKHDAFDLLCLATWLDQKDSCPLCNAKVTFISYEHTTSTNRKNHVGFRHIQVSEIPYLLDCYHAQAPDAVHPRRQALTSTFPGPSSLPPFDTDVLIRRYVYQHKLYSLHVGCNGISGYRNFNPESLRASPALQSRARSWIRRELRVFQFLFRDLGSDPARSGAGVAITSPSAEFLVEHMIQVLKTWDIRASDGRAEDLVTEYIGRNNARLFLHELGSYLRSPFTRLEEWDKSLQYKDRIPAGFDDIGHPSWFRDTREVPAAQRNVPWRPDFDEIGAMREWKAKGRFVEDGGDPSAPLTNIWGGST
ncbi:hypothetical protein M011DRAFT_473429 [Sporormia fimetaria CBS 119925]|uniref:RING-type E3 ubiquitin transferase n=1 Tax=Sporormia fimetaria CBS 119925 TaxID=1340428 RepID=A0A6A6VSB5_9PLEO|nr:hypothetical protein M011DRAFT_473429 [Sporormia fimetaria CBS 119925]